MKEQQTQMFLRQRWQGLLVALPNILLRKEEQGIISKRELDYFFSCLEQLTGDEVPAVLNLLADYETKLDELSAKEETAIREIINGSDWSDRMGERGVAVAIRTVLELTKED
ncbi:hypothetical protein MFMK1_002323 [Metallumcola ferriviriculae]|uniref:Uncharacterized protein n=1 Tax=Metallumcola ferriviriculae TaxID=3039180 RepID=A0AAU0UQL8_9FIRM|nr:hypothetical protein MFMK1_002323 [Desulfitibacteraceae bacterium MK1]